ncbi:MAG: replicative DNA helicase [Clostridia bacterium]|nr:replicative DNA helicase [Clostridia bacterium]
MESNLMASGNLNLPYSLDAEQAVLGAILKDPECLPTVSDMLKIDHLYLPQHKAIYTATLNIDTMGGRIDPLVVLEELKKEGVYDDIGGKTYLMKIADAVPSTKNVESYIKIIIDKFYLRTLMLTAREILEKTSDGTDSPDHLLNLAEQKIYDIRRGKNVSGPAKVSDIIMHDVFERIKKLGSIDPKEREKYIGIPTGFSYLDKVLGGGFHRSDFIVIGARPAMGKTSFALNVARNIAIKGRKVLFFSLEMSKEQLAQRIVSTEARIISNKLRTGDVNESDWEKLGLALQNLINCELYFDDQANINVNEMKARALRMKDVDCIVIDYLQLMSGTKRSENRVNEVSEITRGLKMMAKDLNIPVVTCSQLSRGVAKNSTDHRPQMTDLRESGTIEQDADIVLMLHREDYYKNNEEDSDTESANIAEVIVGKNRHGSTETVKVAWNPEFTMFSTLERINDDR